MNSNFLSGTRENTRNEVLNQQANNRALYYSFPDHHEYVTDDSFDTETFIVIELLEDSTITYNDGKTIHSNKALTFPQQIVGQSLTGLDVSAGSVRAYYKPIVS